MTQFHEKTLNKNQKLSLTSLRKNSMFIVYIMQIWKMFKFRHIHMQYYALFSKSIRVHLVSQIWSKKYYLGRAAIYTKIMVKNCVTFQKLCFFFSFFYSKYCICGWHIPFRFKISELKELPFGYTYSSLSFIFDWYFVGYRAFWPCSWKCKTHFIT